MEIFGLTSLPHPFVLAGASMISLVIYEILWIIYARSFHPLSSIPGPFLASFSRIWIVRQTMHGDMDVVQRDLHRRYGPLIRLAHNEIGCSDPEALKTIYGVKTAFVKTDFYPQWHNKAVGTYPDYFSNTDEKSHSERRRIVNNVYSLSNVLQSEAYIDQCSALFVQRMGEYADCGASVDLGRWLQMYAFDVVGELFFGKMFGFMTERSDFGSYIEALETLMPAMVASAIAATYVRPFILGSAVLSASSRKALHAFSHIAESAKSCVRQYSEDLAAGKETRRDMLSQFFEIKRDRGEKIGFATTHIEQEAYVAMFAGSDTTAIAMRATLYFLLTNPATLRRAVDELDQAASKGELSNPVQYSEAIKLPYMCACIKEAMRLHPSVGLTLPRMVPTGGAEFCGKFIPGGYRIGINAAVIQYDVGVFGNDAELFNPSRWLERDTTSMDRCMFQFGLGSRTCIGKNISISEIHKLIPQILRKFDLELTEPTKKWKTANIWFHTQTGLNVRFSRR